jgi:hypothetical protein
MESNLIVAMLMLIVGTGNIACRQADAPRLEDRTIEAWLTCEECKDGELAALVKRGQGAIAPLAAALRTGPSQARLDTTRRQLAKTHQSMLEYAKTHPDAPVPMSESAFVDRHVENFIVQYQTRAATGLGAIGGPAARQELSQAQALPLRPPVMAAVKEALQRLQ